MFLCVRNRNCAEISRKTIFDIRWAEWAGRESPILFHNGPLLIFHLDRPNRIDQTILPAFFRNCTTNNYFFTFFSLVSFHYSSIFMYSDILWRNTICWCHLISVFYRVSIIRSTNHDARIKHWTVTFSNNRTILYRICEYIFKYQSDYLIDSSNCFW